MNNQELSPLLKAKKIISIYPTVLILSSYILILIVSLIINNVLYMDYISTIYISLLFIILIIGTFGRRYIFKSFRDYANFIFINKGKGIVLLLISFIYFGKTYNIFHSIINVLLLCDGILLYLLDYLIAGEYEQTPSIDHGNNIALSNFSKTENDSQLDKDDKNHNNPYAIPEDF